MDLSSLPDFSSLPSLLQNIEIPPEFNSLSYCCKSPQQYAITVLDFIGQPHFSSPPQYVSPDGLSPIFVPGSGRLAYCPSNCRTIFIPGDGLFPEKNVVVPLTGGPIDNMADKAPRRILYVQPGCKTVYIQDPWCRHGRYVNVKGGRAEGGRAEGGIAPFNPKGSAFAKNPKGSAPQKK